MFNIFFPDKLRKEVERISNGRVTVLYDNKSSPSFMAVIPKIKIRNLVDCFNPNLEGKFPVFAYKYYNTIAGNLFASIFENTPEVNGRYTLDDAHPAFVINNLDGSYNEVSYIYLGLFQGNTTVPYSWPNREIYTGEWIDGNECFDKDIFNYTGNKSSNWVMGKFIDQFLKPEYRGVTSASYYKSLMSAHKKNIFGSTSWRVMNIWAYSLLRHILYFKKLVGGCDSQGYELYDYEHKYSQEYSGKIRESTFDFGDSVTAVTILVPQSDQIFFQNIVNDLMSKNIRIVVHGAKGKCIGYLKGITTFYTINSELSSRGINGYIPYRIILDKFNGRLMDYGYKLTSSNITSNEPEKLVFSYVWEGYVHGFMFPVLEHSLVYYSKTVSRNYNNYVNVSSLYNEYVFDKDSEFYRVFGISDILFSLYSEANLVDGLFLVPFYVSLKNGHISYLNHGMRSFVPVAVEGHPIRYVTEDGINLSERYYNYSFDKNSTRCSRFFGDWGGIDPTILYKRFPVEWRVDKNNNSIVFEFTKFPRFLPYRKDSFISYINTEYTKNKNWQNYMDDFFPFVYGMGKSYLIGREYVAREYVNSQMNILRYISNWRNFNYKDYITEFRLFLLSSLVAGYKSIVFECSRQFEDIFFGNFNNRNRKYYNMGQVDEEVIQSVRYSDNLPRYAMKNYLYPGEFFLYRGSANPSFNYRKSVSGEDKDWYSMDRLDRDISLYSNSFTQIDLFNFRLMYVPGV